MKFSTLVLSLSLATATRFVAAQPRKAHGHGHAGQDSSDETATVVRGATVTVYELNGTPVPWDKVEQGLKDGSLTIINGSVAAKTAVAEKTAAPSQSAPSEPKKEAASATPTPEATPEVKPKPEEPKKDKKDDEEKGDKKDEKKEETKKSSAPSGGKGVDRDFPDGELDCSDFPSEYGAVKIPWQGLGGWTGLQKIVWTADGSGVADIHMAKSGPCSDGMMCSYACPTGYQKAQWPKAQGTKGQSVGGIECKDGKLRLPQGSLSKKLCIAGTGGVKVHNTLGKDVTICRTDYPASEEMNVPATMDPSSSDPYELTCPNQNTYYQWQEKKTSAQYYVNPIGTPLEKGCSWSEAGSDMGNWAPLNLGVSELDGTKWLSIFQNGPTNVKGKLNFKIEIKVEGEDECVCKYENQKYWQNGKANDDGCTVGTTKNAVYVLS